MLNKLNDNTAGGEGWLRSKLEPNNKVNGEALWGRYKYLYRHDANLSPLDQAVKWYLTFRGYECDIRDWNDKRDLYELDNEMDALLKREIQGFQPLIGEGEIL